MADYWFRPRRVGYGAHPNTWQGWLYLGVFAAVMIGYVKLPQDYLAQQPVLAYLLWAIGGLLLVLAFVQGAKAKTSGEWRFRKRGEE